VTRKTVKDFHPEVLKLFDGYVHGRVTRREFLDLAAKFAVGGVSAAAMLESLRPNFALAQQVPETDPRVRAAMMEYPSPKGSGKMKGYLAQPAAAPAKRSCIVVIHENRGLSPYIKDVARRLAAEGYVALAPDALAPVGGYPGDEEKALDMFKNLDPAKRNEDLIAAVDWMKARGDCQGRIGAIGFCLGGGIVNQIAVRYPDLKANTTMLNLMEELTSTENKVSFARQAYNDAVMAYNTRREVFPTNLSAGPFNFGPAELFVIDKPEEKEAPKAAQA